MRKITNFFRTDFKVVSESLCYMTGKNIPKVFLLLYYVTVLIIILPIIPFFMIWKIYKTNKLFKEWEEKEEA